MEKVIKIEDKEVRLSNCVAWTMEYRDQFNKDPLEAFVPAMASLMEAVSSVINEAGTDGIGAKDIAGALEGRAFDILIPMMQMGFVDAVVNVTWAMAKAADESIAPPKQWVRQFDSFPLDVIVPAVGELMMKGFSSSKNWERLKSLGADLKSLQPSLSMTSSSQG